MPLTALSVTTLASMQPSVRGPKRRWGEFDTAFHDVWRAAWAANIPTYIVHGSTLYGA
jgi:hypothetical protein